MRAFVSILALAGVAAADPKVCIPPDRGLALHVRDGKAIACTNDACWSVTRDGTVASVPQPAPLPDPPTPSRIDHDKGVCLGTVCKPAGKTVRTAAAALRNITIGGGTPREQQLHVTPDHEVVIIKGKAFRIATDKLLALKAPVEFVKLRYPPVKKPALLRTEGIGNILLATWECANTTCDGDVPMAVAVDTKGKTQSAWFPAGKAIELDADRLIVMGAEQTQVTSLSPSTGTLIGALTLSDGDIDGSAAKVDADTIAVLTRAGGYDLYWVSVPKDKPPSKLARHSLPLCPRAKP